ncbi:hypothetical protein SKAU_G00356380 [Synaphobranchus kaupii]|uniref:Uncharacterized protein n=1 Tax=Synaphobranchus kaupii TaxID=118154 RepID=A0A9Q1IGG7_SYNKA|nr:hypothetical protein SKAU_G00356380 [Synaphobranchus kaupii]
MKRSAGTSMFVSTILENNSRGVRKHICFASAASPEERFKRKSVSAKTTAAQLLASRGKTGRVWLLAEAGVRSGREDRDQNDARPKGVSRRTGILGFSRPRDRELEVLEELTHTRSYDDSRPASGPGTGPAGIRGQRGSGNDLLLTLWTGQPRDMISDDRRHLLSAERLALLTAHSPAQFLRFPHWKDS